MSIILTKDELLEHNVIVIEHELNLVHLENLEHTLKNKTDNFVIVIMNDIQKGNYSYAVKMAEILYYSECNVAFLCNGNINITGIIPLLSEQFKFRTATEGTKFDFNVKEYIKSSVEPEEQENFRQLFKKILFDQSLLSDVEISLLYSKGTIFNVNDAFCCGMIDNITDCNLYNGELNMKYILQIKEDMKLVCERRERDRLKCQGAFTFIPLSYN